MISSPTKYLTLASALLSSTFFAGGATAAAQTYVPPSAPIQPYREDPASALTRHLRDLNSSPRSLFSLLGAGQAALDVGDPQAALTFFARAEEVAPRDGRVKAGMASAFVHTEQPAAALRFFAEAASLGIPVMAFAKDRGLAYDMSGDPVRAQADYALALQRGSDPEVERRLALSKAITGDRAGALRVLDPQLRRSDQAGWRARAFVLALTGDAAGALQAVRAVMPLQASAMGPFLARLPQLSAADRAMAVHFGRFPRQGQPYAGVQYPQAQPVQNQYVPPQPVQNQYRPAQPVQNQYVAPQPVQNQYRPPQPAQNQYVPPQPVQNQYRPPQPAQNQVARPQPSQNQYAPGPLAAASVAGRPDQRQPQPPRATAPVQLPPASPGIGQQAAGFASQVPAVQAPPPAAAPAPAAPSAADNSDFRDVVATVQSLPSAPAPAPAARPVRTAEAKPAAPKPAAKTPQPKAETAKPAAPREPSRIWVQLAVAQDKSAFPGEFKRLKGKAPELLSGKSAWTAPMGRTNRLLVGPFKTEKEAGDFVNQLSKEQISSFRWESDEGQKVEKLPAK
ncbi:MAG TPA: SPOR domain-containing protein [Allosphingosinicella sp.]|nr:SPOR domain-containing protein [Allosphingosinicella sp.]